MRCPAAFESRLVDFEECGQASFPTIGLRAFHQPTVNRFRVALARMTLRRHSFRLSRRIELEVTANFFQARSFGLRIGNEATDEPGLDLWRRAREQCDERRYEIGCSQYSESIGPNRLRVDVADDDRDFGLRQMVSEQQTSSYRPYVRPRGLAVNLAIQPRRPTTDAKLPKGLLPRMNVEPFFFFAASRPDPKWPHAIVVLPVSCRVLRIEIV